ncbi:MAG TPA: maleylpyruvate isomerase family mycothiol-dependent enzyme [Acidimicrobiia bacterium]
METWDLVAAERNDLADLLETLSEQQWNTETLCEGWKVRDLTGHLVEGAEKLKWGRLIGAMVKSGFRINVMLDRGAREMGALPTPDLMKRMRESAGYQFTAPGVKPIGMLAETVTHSQDIRRPLGKPRQIPEETLRISLDYMAAQGASVLPNKKRIAGLKLQATDLDWTHGDGSVVTGSGEALLMAIAGRKAALTDLGGEGEDTLASRL